MHTPTYPIQKSKLIEASLQFSDTVHYQLEPEELVAQVVQRGEGQLSDTGALTIHTGEFTGRSPKDKFIVKDEITSATVDWNEFNQSIEQKYFDIILKKITDYLSDQKEIWVRDGFACADPQYKTSLRVITETPAMSLFAYNMFLRPTKIELEDIDPTWQLFCAPGLKLNPVECGIRQHNTTIVSFHHKIILIAGSGYTGEIKKGIFSILNFILPQEKNVLSMHCSANIGKQGDTAIFFGLSGTGKTTLSTDPERMLIGDDEHGWADDKVFNFEGGCYAKCINLSKEKEPEIFAAIRKGALVENIKFFPGTNKINFEDGSITENTRVSYPLNYIANAVEPSIGKAPKNIFFLACDAYGVLPPISKLTAEQAMYMFLSGYTAKIAGTETGIKDPKLTFSTCFGAPFLPLHPSKYAALLGEKIKQQNASVWMVNTGWTGGPYLVGNRIKLSFTRAMVSAALQGKLDAVPFIKHPVFGMAMPTSCLGVPSELLDPIKTWKNKEAYQVQAKCLAEKFIDNFKQYENSVSPEILQAAPLF
ncbi:MAG: phosphoenolpyruvate carboxykinase (ATP) [Bacteroidetes bacterium]|nr:phosphoenolpyruvate carboxykinase (ATP) [Bacteroidota bacterium]